MSSARAWSVHSGAVHSQNIPPAGAGFPEVSPPTDTYPEYWGHVETSTPLCARHVFNHVNTQDSAWDNEALARSVCHDAGADAGGVISNTIVFTHSMGNLIMAHALESGFCRFAPSSDWYAVASPAKGSAAASLEVNACRHETAAALHTIAVAENAVRRRPSPDHRNATCRCSSLPRR